MRKNRRLIKQKLEQTGYVCFYYKEDNGVRNKMNRNLYIKGQKMIHHSEVYETGI